MKLVRYFLVGGAAAAVDLGLFFAFAKVLGWNYLAVGAATFVIATLVNYWLSVEHVFASGSRFSRPAEMALVFGVSAVGLLVNQMILYLCVEWVRLDVMAAKILASGIVFFWNYTARSRFIFPVRQKILETDDGL